MDNKKAIALLSMIEFKYAKCCLGTWYHGIDSDMKEALKMAIQALEQEPCDHYTEGYFKGYDDGQKGKLEQESCEDAITRILKRMWNCRGKHTTSIDKVKMEQIIRDELPSVNLKADVLDKIRAEITAVTINGQVDEHTMFIRTGEQVKQLALDIIDKYKVESERNNR